jgi:Flp pilus assembly protein TadG
LLTEIAVGRQPLSQNQIKGKAGAVLGLIADESGATAIEYTLIAVLVVMALVLSSLRSGTSSARLSRQSRASFDAAQRHRKTESF